MTAANNIKTLGCELEDIDYDSLYRAVVLDHLTGHTWIRHHRDWNFIKNEKLKFI